MEGMSPDAPDSQFRDHAANERTMLAWIRTGIALMAFGFAIARFALFLRQLEQLREPGASSAHGLESTWFGVTFVVFGLLVNAAAVARYRANRRALLERRPLPPSPTLVYAVGVASVIIGVVMAGVLAASSH
jgi:inner membrane protein YidH